MSPPEKDFGVKSEKWLVQPCPEVTTFLNEDNSKQRVITFTQGGIAMGTFTWACTMILL